MVDIDMETAIRIIDGLHFVIRGKPSSAKTIEEKPRTDLAHYSAWGPPKYVSVNDTPRSFALTLPMLLFSGGRIPLQGIEINGFWYKPEQYLVNELLHKGRGVLNEAQTEITFTQSGWEWLASSIEALPKALIVKG